MTWIFQRLKLFTLTALSKGFCYIICSLCFTMFNRNMNSCAYMVTMFGQLMTWIFQRLKLFILTALSKGFCYIICSLCFTMFNRNMNSCAYMYPMLTWVGRQKQIHRGIHWVDLVHCCTHILVSCICFLLSQGSIKEMLNLSQQDYVKRIEELNQVQHSVLCLLLLLLLLDLR